MPDPEVGIGAFPLPVETRLGPQIIRVGATQMLPWKGILDSKKELEVAKAKTLYERIGASTLDLSYQIKQAWYNLYEIEQSQTIIQRNLGILESLDRLALAKIESGNATGADVLRVQLKVEELKQELAILETAKAKPTTTINQLLNRDLATPITVNDSLAFAQMPFQKDSLAASIRTNHPMIRMFALQVPLICVLHFLDFHGFMCQTLPILRQLCSYTVRTKNQKVAGLSITIAVKFSTNYSMYCTVL